MDVVLLDDHVAEVDADPESYPTIVRKAHIPPSHRRLDGKRVAHRIHRASELDQDPVAHGLDDAPAVGCDPWADQLGVQAPETNTRSFLVSLYQTTVTDHVGGQDSCAPLGGQ